MLARLDLHDCWAAIHGAQYSDFLLSSDEPQDEGVRLTLRPTKLRGYTSGYRKGGNSDKLCRLDRVHCSRGLP